jgi:plasmid rolling circle replication initiator protein Rep
MKDYSTTLTRLQDKKNRGYLLAASYMRLGQTDRAKLVAECGTYIGMAETTEGVSIVEANFCKQRLCPACSWRRSIKIYGATSRILDYLDATEGKAIKYLFLTLTIRNVPLERLSVAIDDMAAAYHRLTCNRSWKKRVKGAMRTLEVTINHETGQAHPHYHLILAVDRSYATKGDTTYWTHADWQRAWQQAARLDYAPQVSIERVRGRKAGVAEVSKYMAKDTDYLIDSMEAQMGTEEAEALTDYLVEQLSRQLHGRRLVSYTGILRKAQQALRIKDPETGPLVDEIRGDVTSAIKHYHWAAGLGRYVPARKETAG